MSKPETIGRGKMQERRERERLRQKHIVWKDKSDRNKMKQARKNSDNSSMPWGVMISHETEHVESLNDK